MQENNFEKQVQDKMEELKIKPSEEVWHTVAGTLAKTKNDRRIIGFILLALLFIGSAFYILFNQPGKLDNNKQSAKKLLQAKDSSNKMAGDRAAEKLAGDRNINIAAKQPVAEKTNKEIHPDKKISQQHKRDFVTTNNVTSGKFNSRAKDLDDLTDNVINKQNKISYKTKPKQIVLITKADAEAVINDDITLVDAAKTIVKITTALSEQENLNLPTPDTVNKNKIQRKPVNIPTAAPLESGIKDVAQSKPTPVKPKGKWKLGFNFSAGVATTQNGLLASIGLGNGSANKSLADAFQNSSGVPPPVSSVGYKPSQIESGAGLAFGVYLLKNISFKTKLLAGLNYKQYNSAMVIGSRVDSTINFAGYNNLQSNNFYYRSGSKTNYKNHFYFIELPITLQLKLSQQNKLPIYLDAGVSISQLLSSNALQFDTLSGAYFSNNTVFNRTQFNIAGGLLFSLFWHHKNPIQVGPGINFSLTKMAALGLYANRHYSYFGLVIKKNIGKK